MMRLIPWADTPRRPSSRLVLACLMPIVAFALVSCQNESGPVNFEIPYGTFRRADTTTVGGTTVRQSHTVVLSVEDGGLMLDTISTLVGGAWRVDSVAQTMLHFEQLGDGYLRTLEIAQPANDTTLRYWYFFRRDSKLFFYVGDRLLGSNVGLYGEWRSDPRDTALQGRNYSLRFTNDSVQVAGRYSDAGAVNGTFAYSTSGSLLSVPALPSVLGPRFEVVPAIALYLTTPASGGYPEVR